MPSCDTIEDDDYLHASKAPDLRYARMTPGRRRGLRVLVSASICWSNAIYETLLESFHWRCMCLFVGEGAQIQFNSFQMPLPDL